MGLAATQARFLAITSRKANCEFRTMELAQQKLSLSRELEKATMDYNNALEASKIIWDVDGTGAYRYNLSYGVMMEPSDLNQYLPYLVSRQDGKIAVDDKMREALNGVVNDDGAIWNGAAWVYYGDPGYEAAKQYAYNLFIEGLVENRAIPSSIGTKLFDGTDYTYMPDAGIGGELFGRETGNMMTIGNMMAYIDNIVSMVSSNQFPPGSPEANLANALVFDFGDPSGSQHYLLSEHVKRNGATNMYINQSHFSGTVYSQNSSLTTSQDALSLSDLLNSNVTLAFLNNNDTFTDNYNHAINKILQYISNGNINKIINSDPAEWFNEAIGAVPTYDTAANPPNPLPAGYTPPILVQAKDNCPDWCKGDAGAGVSSSSKYGYEWLQYVANKEYSLGLNDNLEKPGATTLATVNYIDNLVKSMYNLLMPDSNESTPGIDASSENMNYFISALESTVRAFVCTESNYVEVKSGWNRTANCETQAVKNADKYNCWTKYKGAYAMSLSNLTEAFLTNFVDGLDNYQNGCLITKNASSSVYITDDPSYLFTVNLTEQPEERLWEAEFYSIIFNNICTSGWYENQKLNDNAYLNNAIKNGQLFITSLNEQDYNYYQNRYAQTYGGHIKEETDEDAVAQAEREYTYIKNRINYKEQRIEVETKSVDAELLSLNTEYETVKNLISKSIDNTFKQFQS